MRTPVYDLSVPFAADMPTSGFWENRSHPPMFAAFTDIGDTSLGPGRTSFVSLVSFLTHTGTHLETSRHYLHAGWFLHQVPLDRFFGEGPVLGIRKGPKEDITPRDLETAGLEIRQGDLVAINTGWFHHYTTPKEDWDRAKYYFTHNPGLNGESAAWLAERGVHTVLIDTPAIDAAPHMPIGDRQAHMTLFKHDIPVVENLGQDLDRVTGKRCTICCAPVNYVNAEAFPVRVLASPLG